LLNRLVNSAASVPAAFPAAPGFLAVPLLWRHMHFPRLLLLAVSALSLVLGACRDETTGPNPVTDPNAARPQPTAPELAVAQNSWRTRADMWGIERTNFAAAVVPNSAGQSILYAIGGSTTTGSTLSRVMAYNAATNVWTLKSPMPVPVTQSNGAGAIGSKIYVSGGLRTRGEKSYTADLYVYDTSTDSWTRKSDMPDLGTNGFTGVLGGKLYVVTSCNDPEACGGKWLYRYDPLADSWTALAPPPANIDYRFRLMGGTIGQKLYIGVPGSSTLSVYDPGSNSWSQRSTHVTVRIGAASTTLNAKLYMMGGLDANWQKVRTTNVYDPATNSWTTAAPLPTARFSTVAVRLAVSGAKIELVGGARPGNNVQYTP
jgi:N-acetylneuraminic acid mutarotase